MTRPSWLGRAVRNQNRHAIEQASRRWRGGRRGDSGRTRREFDFHTGVHELPRHDVGDHPHGVACGVLNDVEASHRWRQCHRCTHHSIITQDGTGRALGAPARRPAGPVPPLAAPGVHGARGALRVQPDAVPPPGERLVSKCRQTSSLQLIRDPNTPQTPSARRRRPSGDRRLVRGGARHLQLKGTRSSG